MTITAVHGSIWAGLLAMGLLVACSSSKDPLRYDGVNRALRFDGDDDYVTLPTAGFPTALGAVSIAAWLKLDRTTGKQTLAKVGRGSLSGVTLGLDDANPTALRVWGPTVFAGSDEPVSEGEWHHIAYVFDGETHALYVDGNCVATGAEYANNRSPSLVWLGATDGTSEFLAGELDEFRVWNRALSEAELSSSFDAVDERDLVMSLTFDEVAGARVYDSSSEGNHGLLGDGIEQLMPARITSDRKP